MRVLLIFCFLFYHFELLAQEVSVSEPISLRSEATFNILGKLEGKTIVFINKSTTFELVAFNDKMYKSWQKEIELEKRFPKVLSVIAPDQTGFFLTYTHRQKNHTILKVHHYDHTGNVLDTVTIKDFGSRLYTPRLQTYYSEDKTKLLLYELESAKIKNIFVFDTQTMELLWEDTFEDFDLGTSDQELHQIVIDNIGNVYLILARDNFSSKNKVHHFEIMERHVGSSQKVIYNIDLGGKLTYDNAFEYDNLNQNLVGGGLYSDKNRGRTQGYYYLRIPKGDYKNHVFASHKFDQDFQEEFMDKPNLKQEGINDTEVKEILFRRDGGILMLGERSKRNTREQGTSTYYNPYVKGARDFFFNNMYIYSIHPTGKMHWRHVLHKKQYSYDDDGVYSSYFLLKTPSNIRLIYNDEIKNENTVSEYVIRGDGEYKRNSILSTENQDIRLQFRESVQTDAREFIVPSERRNRLRLVRLRF